MPKEQYGAGKDADADHVKQLVSFQTAAALAELLLDKTAHCFGKAHWQECEAGLHQCNNDKFPNVSFQDMINALISDSPKGSVFM